MFGICVFTTDGYDMKRTVNEDDKINGTLNAVMRSNHVTKMLVHDNSILL